MKKTVEIDYLRSCFSYDPETGIVTRLKDGAKLTAIGDRGYLIVNWNKQIWKVHRIAWALHYGDWPKEDIDHINRNRSDNRLANLRETSRSENIFNSKTRSNNTSGCPGVNFDRSRNKWMARVGTQLIGRFKSFEEAVAARKAHSAAFVPRG